jgi:hypothetical protein
MSTGMVTTSRTRTMRVPRTRGAVSGVLLVLLGGWGALVPFIGPYFDYSYGTDRTWVWTTARFWLEVLPGAVTALGGVLLLVSANRLRGGAGGWLAVLGGGWFVLGRTLAPSWRLGDPGQPLSQHNGGRAVAELGYFSGLGALILFLAAFALGRLAVVGVRDLQAAERADRRAAEEERAQQERTRLAAEQQAGMARMPVEPRAAEPGVREGQSPTQPAPRDGQGTAAVPPAAATAQPGHLPAHQAAPLEPPAG